MLDGLEIIDANYLFALNLLCEQYSDHSKLKMKIQQNIAVLKPPAHTSSELREFRNLLLALMRRLYALCSPAESELYITTQLNSLLSRDTKYELHNLYKKQQLSYSEYVRGIDAIIKQLDFCDNGTPVQPLKQVVTVRRTTTNAAQNDISNSKTNSQIASTSNESQTNVINNTPSSKFKHKTKQVTSVHLQQKPPSTSPNETPTAKRSLSQSPAKFNSNTSQQQNFLPKKPSVSTTACVLCTESTHYSSDCSQYITVQDRKNRLISLQRCHYCFSLNHSSNDCKSNVNCYYCKKSGHSRPLCYQYVCDYVTPKYSNTVSLNRFSQCAPASVCLPTVQGTLRYKSRTYNARIFLDVGAQTSTISPHAANSLNLSPLYTKTSTINTFNGDKVQTLEYVSCSVHIGAKYRKVYAAIHANTSMQFHAPGLKNLANYISTNYDCKLGDIYDNDLVENIDLMLGAEHFSYFVESFQHFEDISLLRTPGGSCITGKVPDRFVTETCANVSFRSISINRLTTADIRHSNVELKQSIDKLSNLDILGIQPTPFSTLEQYALDHFAENVHKSDTRYTVSFPFVPDKLPARNEKTAYATLKSLNVKFQREPELHSAYAKILDDYLANDFVEVVPFSEIPNDSYYMPHHCVKKQSLSTPIRIVFNGSSHSSDTLSLNQCIVPGPSLSSKLYDIVLKFRSKVYVIISDISKAFLRLTLSEEHRDFTRFLFNFDLQRPYDITTLRFKVVPFGISCSPFLLSKCIEYHCSQYDDPFSRNLHSSFYVDNYVHTVNNASELERIYAKATDIMSNANMPLRQWCSNHQSFNLLHSDESLEDSIVLLGLKYNHLSDSFQLRPVHNNPIDKCTRRTMLSALNMLYDLLGLFNPVLITGKIILQQTWLLKLGWDDIVPESLATQFSEFLLDVKRIPDVSIPRSVGKFICPSLHLFCDASALAYGTVAYIVENNCAKLLTSKARITPPSKRIIHEYELVSIYLACKLASHLIQVFSDIKSVTIWTDSLVSMGWIRSDKSSKIFVRNRVAQIRQYNFCLKYVNTHSNIADLLTRGVSLSHLQQQQWFVGPEWLTQSPLPNFLPSNVPHNTILLSELTCEPRNAPLFHFSIRLNFEAYSKYSSLERSIKIWQRFLNQKFKCEKFNRTPLTVCIVLAQKQSLT
ncbi:MAG: reverse transcriptase domain-containing protein, partial [Bacteroidota bacterium]